ncbi:hypothetical protein P879_11720, partial [Paragonimus westermani]
ASSPDEKALVEAAANLGLSLVSTLPDPVDNETRRLIIERRLPVEDKDTVTEHQRQQVDKLEYLVDAVLDFIQYVNA